MKRRWLGMLGFVLVLVAAALRLAGTGQGPVHQGKSAQEWLRELSRSEPARREAAHRAFAAMGEDAIPLLKRELSCRDSILKRGLMRLDEGVAWVRIEWTTDAQRRRAAIWAAEELGGRGEALLPQLLKAFYEQSETGWIYPSTRVFEGIGVRAIPAMIEAMHLHRGRPCEGEYALLQAWIGINRAQGIPEVLIPKMIDLALQRLVHPRHDKEAQNAMRLIAEFPGHAGRALPSLIRSLAEGSPAVCQTSMDVLGIIGREPEQVVRALILRLNDPDSAVRAAALKALAHWGAAAVPAIPSMAGLVRDETRAVQLAALGALSQMGAEAGWTSPVLVEALQRGETWVKAEAARTLGLVRPDPGLAVPALMHALVDEDRDIRCHAAASLGTFGKAAASAVDALIGLLVADHREAVQVCVVQALGKIGASSRPAIPHLMAAWNNNQSLLAGPVNEAIANIEQMEGEGRTIGAELLGQDY